jgi:hypothetical protein
MPPWPLGYEHANADGYSQQQCQCEHDQKTAHLVRVIGMFVGPAL